MSEGLWQETVKYLETGKWDKTLGPRPDQPGTLVSMEVLKEFGLFQLYHDPELQIQEDHQGGKVTPISISENEAEPSSSTTQDEVPQVIEVAESVPQAVEVAEPEAHQSEACLNSSTTLKEDEPVEEIRAGRRAEQFLRLQLQDGPRPAKEMLRLAQEAGIADSTLDRSREKLRIRAVKKGFVNSHWTWSLPENAEESHERHHNRHD
jgi:hypothetical protein